MLEPVVFIGPDEAAVDGAVRLGDAQAAVYAADGYARASGAPALCIVSGLAQALEAASALLTAWGDKLPLCVAIRLRTEERARVAAALAAVTRARSVVETDAGLFVRVAQAKTALLRAGPATLFIDPALDSARIAAAWRSAEGESPVAPALDSVGVSRAARMLRSYEKPVVLAGSGAVCSVEPAALAALAHALDCPVLLTSSASTMPAPRLRALRDAFADGALVPSGNLVWVKALAGADGVLALGTALSETDWFGLTDTRLARGELIRVALERAPRELAKLFVQMDAGAFVDALRGEVGTPGAGGHVGGVRRGIERWQARLADEADRQSRLDHIEPQLAARSIVDAAPDGTIFATEGGSCGMWLWSNLWLQPLVFPVQNGTIGVPIPMARGASAAHPGRPVWSVVGDGAFFYTAPELARLADAPGPLVFFVFNDAAWSAIRLGQTFLFGGRYAGTDLPDTDYASVAELHGCEGVRVRTPDELARAVARAREHRAGPPLVVDIALPRDHVPFAGVNFVLAELDGALGSLALQSVGSTTKSLLSGHLSLDSLGSLFRVGR